MKVTCAPLVYGRTYQVDFGSDFLIRPKYLTGSAAAPAFERVRSSMDAFDLAPEGGRTVVFGDGRVAIAGVTVFFEDLFAECGREPAYHRLDRADGRKAYGFVGVAIPVGDVQGVPVIPRAKLLDLYCRCIGPAWNDEYAEGGGIRRYTVRETEMTFDEMPGERVEPVLRAISIGLMGGKNTVVLNSGEADRDAAAAAALALALRGEQIAFCSDVDGIRMEKTKVFSVMTSRTPAAFDARPAAKEDLPAGEKKPKTAKEPKTTGGYDDVLAALDRSSAGTDRGEKESSLVDDVCRRLKALGESWGIDAAAVLGAAAGVVYVVVGALHSVNPVVLAIAGAATLVIIGLEARRLIERYRRKQ